jgi:hypothetical protein
MAGVEQAHLSDCIDPEDLYRRLYQVLLDQKLAAERRQHDKSKSDGSNVSRGMSSRLSRLSKAVSRPAAADVQQPPEEYHHVPKEAASQFSRTTKRISRASIKQGQGLTAESFGSYEASGNNSTIRASATPGQSVPCDHDNAETQSEQAINCETDYSHAHAVDQNGLATTVEPRVDWTQSDECRATTRPVWKPVHVLEPILRPAQSLRDLKRKIVRRRSEHIGLIAESAMLDASAPSDAP